MQKKSLLLIPAAIAVATGAFASTSPSVQSWTTYQGNALHTGYVPVTLNPAQFAVAWTAPIGGASLQQVTESDGMVYVSQTGYFSDQGLYVLDAQDGSVLWSLLFPNIFSVNPPAYDNGNIYIQTVNNGGDSWVRGYEASSGTPIFQSAQGAQWENYLAPTIVDHTLYVDGGTYGGMYSFDGATGAQNWFNGQLAQYDQWTPAVDATDAYTYVGGTFSAVNRTTGAIDYSIKDPDFSWTGYDMGEAPALGSMNDAVVFNVGRLLSFNLRTHRIRWTKTAGYSAQPSIAGGVIYVVNNGTLAALDELSGDQLWMWSAPSDMLSGPVAVTDSHVFVRGAATTYAIDLDTHQAVWSYPAAGPLTLSEGQLFIAGSTGILTDISLGLPITGGANLKETLTDQHVGTGTPGAYAFVAMTQNRGPSNATRVTVTVAVPRSFGVQSMGAGCRLNGHDIICTYSGIASGMAAQSRFVLVPAMAGNFSIVAKAAATQADPFTLNNIAIARVAVQ